MAFEDKMKQLKKSIPQSSTSKTSPDHLKDENYGIDSEPRVSKSYTLKPRIAAELTKRASENELTASRYLERILRNLFKMS